MLSKSGIGKGTTKTTTFVLPFGDEEPSKLTHMMGDDDGEEGGDVPEDVKAAALDVAEALGIKRDEVDAEDLARALDGFLDACESAKKGAAKDGEEEGY